MFIVNTLAPLVFPVLLGIILRSTGFAPKGFFENLNRMVYWITLPLLLFAKMAQASIDWSSAAWLIGLLFGGAIFSLFLALITGILFRLPPPSLASFLQGAFRGNLAFIGLPVVLFALGDGDNAQADHIQAVAVLGLAPIIPFYNIVSVVVLMFGRQSEEESIAARLKMMVIGVASNPLVVSCFAGIAFSFTRLALPTIISRPFNLLGQTSLPLALIAIGASLNLQAVKGHFFTATAAALIKVAAAPVALFWISRYVSFPHPEYRIAQLYLACPTAVSSYVMARLLKADDSLAGSIIVVSTILSLPAFIFVLSFM